MMMVERASTNRGSRRFNKKVDVLAELAGAWARHICFVASWRFTIPHSTTPSFPFSRFHDTEAVLGSTVLDASRRAIQKIWIIYGLFGTRSGVSERRSLTFRN